MDSVDRLVDAYREGAISRREFVKRGAALGLTMSAISGLLAQSAGAVGGRVERSAPKRGGTLKEGYDLDFSRMDPIATTWYDPGFF